MKAKLLDLIKKGISSFTSKRWRQPQHDCKIGTECLKSLFLIRSIRFIAVKRARFHTAGSISVRNYPEINLLPHAGKCFFRGSPQNANICSLALTTHALRASGERITNTVIHPSYPRAVTLRCISGGVSQMHFVELALIIWTRSRYWIHRDSISSCSIVPGFEFESSPCNVCQSENGALWCACILTSHCRKDTIREKHQKSNFHDLRDDTHHVELVLPYARE